MEEIRGAAIRHYEEKKPRLWEIFVKELKGGEIFRGRRSGFLLRDSQSAIVKEELPEIGPSIGNWKCEAKEDGIDLIRALDLTESGKPMSIQFYVHLVKKDGRWTAVYDSYLEWRWSPEEELHPCSEGWKRPESGRLIGDRLYTPLWV